MSNDKVSIIVPVFNSENTIDECISSLVNQTYKNIEIILVNDGSTDKSKEKCNNFLKKDKRIILINKKNAGVSNARNYGIEKATGDLLMFVDSDDYIEPDMIRKMIRLHNRESMEVCFFCMVFSNGKKIKEIKLPESNTADSILPYAVDNTTNIGGYMCGKLFDTRIIKKYKLRLNEAITMMEDALFVTEYLTHIKYVNIIKYPLYYYRQLKSSVTHNQRSHSGSIEKALYEIKKTILGYDKKMNVDYISYLQKDYYIKDAIVDDRMKKEIEKINILQLNISAKLKVKYYFKKMIGKKLLSALVRCIKREKLYE